MCVKMVLEFASLALKVIISQTLVNLLLALSVLLVAPNVTVLVNVRRVTKVKVMLWTARLA